MANTPHTKGRSRQGSRLAGSFGQLTRLPIWLIVLVIGGLAFALFIGLDETYRGTLFFISGQDNGLAFRGITVTLTVTFASFGIATLTGALFGLMRASSHALFYNVSSFYVELLRSVPLLVFLLYVTFVIPPILIGAINTAVGWLGLEPILSTRDIPLLLRAIIALALLYSAFIAEIFRAGIQSIERGQVEAGKALGMSYRLRMTNIVLPQAIRRVLPPLGNEFVAIVKDSSLVAILGIQDITQLTRLYYSANFQYLQSLSVLAFVYIVTVIVLSRFISFMERKLAIPED